ncbi:biotin--[acetyl-CoA-carboxylase] ligase [Rhodohalobacter sp.]|uniref:biotin--[acetyl-CoA-carboxylase] ligase n=1 Tax=Rhodohalobacter sp. TaxID=1974210 RepID=UPI003569615F
MSQLFDKELFQDKLSTRWLGRDFEYLKKVDSTNSYLKKIPAEQLNHGFVVLADHQVKGRGQHQKDWVTNPGENLTFTLALKPERTEGLTLLTLSCALAVANVLQIYSRNLFSLKWPNDIYVDHKKIGGVLTECSFLGPKPEKVLIGIGVNVNQEKFNAEDTERATSLNQVTGDKFEREELLANILLRIEKLYQSWTKREITVHKQISKSLIGFGDWIRLSVDDEVIEGRFKFLGVNEKGELLVLNEKLELNTYSHEQIRIITGS